MKASPVVALFLSITASSLVGCGSKKPAPQSTAGSGTGATAGSGTATGSNAAMPPRNYNAISRSDFNRFAVRANLPIYWTADVDNDKNLDANEVASLLFYPSQTAWTKGNAFTPAFDQAYDTIVKLAAAPDAGIAEADLARAKLVAADLDGGRATLVHNDFSKAPADDKVFVAHMLKVAALIDDLYALQNGTATLAPQVKDTLSQSLFRRNRGPKCAAPGTDSNPACTAIAGLNKVAFDVYPADIQKADDFCAVLEKRKDAEALLTPFTVVRADGKGFKAVPYTEAYQAPMAAIAAELRAAADAVKSPNEAPLITYLRAAAQSFTDNNWQPADEAWSKMSVDNSKWYVRVGPDEVYWEPCAHKAGFHLTFALINQGSIAWQKKLVPVQQDMENSIAARAGKPYTARKVTFHLPDFIDIIVNAGDDRDALGATIGQSLPNWGPVANEGRGRTVAMSNLYQDPDSQAARKAQAESLLDATSAANYFVSPEPGLLSTILHEATHNLGPAHEYKAYGKTDDAAFGGPLASVYEELKAQTGGLYLVEFLRGKGLLTDLQAKQTYTDCIVWAFGHISQGMYVGTGKAKTRKAYSNLAAIQIGFLLDKGALTFDANIMAANGTDKGAFVIHHDKLIAAINDMMTTVAGIKARGDGKAANALASKYVDGAVVPHKLITERYLRFPKSSFVFAVTQ